MWIFGGETRKAIGSCGCIWITGTSLIRSQSKSLSEGISSRKILNLFVKSLAEPVRHLKHLSVEYRCAMRADFEMRFHSFTRLGRDLFVKVVGDFAPDFDATDFDGRHSSLLSY